jgi:hypothetical protein
MSRGGLSVFPRTLRFPWMLKIADGVYQETLWRGENIKSRN